MAKMEASRFAVLKIDDDYDSDEKSQNQAKKQNPQNKSAGKQSASQNAKKKSKNKKPSGDSKQVEVNGKGGKKPTELNDSKQWEEWAKRDEQLAEENFQKELQEVIIKSQQQYEEMKQAQATAAAASRNGSASSKKKKNKKDKPVPMSLEEFNQADLSRANEGSDSEDAGVTNQASRPTAVLRPGEADPNFFSRCDDDAKHIIKREHMQKQFQKQYEYESAQTTKLQKDLLLRDKEIILLKATMKNLEEELQQVKKRNQQLCHILAQGEMKNKTELLVELEDLKQVRDDLTVEVQRLTSDLEKERSKVNNLTHGTTERAKGGKHSGK